MNKNPEMEAYDRLPPAARAVLANLDFSMDATHVEKLLRAGVPLPVLKRQMEELCKKLHKVAMSQACPR